MKRILTTLVAWAMAPAWGTGLPTTAPPPTLHAQFTSASIVVDGVAEEAWATAEVQEIAYAYNPEMNGPAQGECPARAQVRALWDGALLYLLVRVTEPAPEASSEKISERDGVEFWVDHFNDKAAKFQEDDGTFTITAPPTMLTANRAQNAIYDNVTSRYLAAHASALRGKRGEADSGYDVEIAWQLGEHAPANGSAFGFNIGINVAGPDGKRRCRLAWNRTDGPLGTHDSSGWGTVLLAGHRNERLPPDTFMLEHNLAKARALVRGIWRDEQALDASVASAGAALSSTDRRTVNRANERLDAALRGLRRAGPYPDPRELPVVRHLPDPFRFFAGGRVKTREDWHRRREEIKALMQYYEFGTAPGRPASLLATSRTRAHSRDINIRMEDLGRTTSFGARLTLPTPEQAAAAGRAAPFPVIVSLDFSLNDGNPNYLAAGYAVLSIPARDVFSDNVAHTGPYFELYPYDVASGRDVGSLAGWGWSASRSVDALEQLLRTDSSFTVELGGQFRPLLALDKLAITGFSRMGKAALLAGMLDERFAVTHAGASGSGGAAPYRFVPFGNRYAWGFTNGSETLGDHLRHQTHNSNEMMRLFLNDTSPAAVQPRMYQTRTNGYGERLPFDHHLEIAAIAPRAVLISNTNDDYGNNAEGDAIGVQAARPVFEWLGAGDRLALDLYMGGGGHSLKLPQQHNLVRFLDQVLFGVPLPSTPPPGDVTNTPTAVQLRRDPYMTGSPGGGNIYDLYYGGLRRMMPWRAPR